MSHGHKQTGKVGESYGAGSTLLSDHIQNYGSKEGREQVILHCLLNQVPGNLVGERHFQLRNIVQDGGKTGVLKDIKRVYLAVIVTMGNGDSCLEESFLFDRRNRLDTLRSDGEGTTDGGLINKNTACRPWSAQASQA